MRSPAAERGDFFDAAFFDADNRAFSVVIRFFARLDLDGVFRRPVDAELRFALLAGFGITGMAQIVGDLLRVGLLADADIARLGVNFGGVGKDGAPMRFSTIFWY